MARTLTLYRPPRSPGLAESVAPLTDLVQNLGIVTFTLLSAGLMAYLLYFLLHPDRA
jgi:K+-transporting ATPase KdpF subunit